MKKIRDKLCAVDPTPSPFQDANKYTFQIKLNQITKWISLVLVQ